MGGCAGAHQSTALRSREKDRGLQPPPPLSQCCTFRESCAAGVHSPTMRHASAALQRAALCGLLLALSAQAARLGESLGMTAEAVKHRISFDDGGTGRNSVRFRSPPRCTHGAACEPAVLVIDTRTDSERRMGTASQAGELRDSGMLRSLSHSFVMILATEIGDETFIVAALMAMRHPKATVFAGAITALIAMTVISAALGCVVPSLISRRATGLAAALLYTFFGCRLMWIAWRSQPNETCEDEIHEVEEKLAGAGTRQSRARRFFSRICTPIFLEAFLLTFMAEWGDRSQIATITLAAHQNPWGVTLGAVAGHAICTGAACVGGELLARRISPRAVATAGGALFLLFAVHQFLTNQ